MKKLTDVSKLNGLGWKHAVSLEHGVERMYNWYLDYVPNTTRINN